jgi:hypothetical protein
MKLSSPRLFSAATALCLALLGDARHHTAQAGAAPATPTAQPVAPAKPPTSAAKPPAPAPTPAQITPEQLKAALEAGSKIRRGVPPAEQAAYAARLQQALREAAVPDTAAQYVLLVDRNPLVQTLFIYWKAAQGPWQFMGAAPVSTGRTGRFDHYLTPLGVFVHTLANPDFRAEGTRNQNGIRGYGVKGMRVYDFGWVSSEKGWGKREAGQIRLQMHATDPGALETRLGQRASKGCVRISAELNRLIDHYGVIDADYEAAAQQGQKLWVLRKDRQAVANPGRYLVVVDSGVTQKPDWLGAAP